MKKIFNIVILGIIITSLTGCATPFDLVVNKSSIKSSEMISCTYEFSNDDYDLYKTYLFAYDDESKVIQRLNYDESYSFKGKYDENGFKNYENNCENMNDYDGINCYSSLTTISAYQSVVINYNILNNKSKNAIKNTNFEKFESYDKESLKEKLISEGYICH